MTPQLIRTSTAYYLLFIFLAPAEAAISENPLVKFFLKSLSLAEPAREEARATLQPLKVFSAGLSRTGTSSMRVALMELAYKPWHGQDGHSDVESVTALASALMTGDASAFLDTLGRGGFNSSVECMLLPVVREALARYPEARVILTVRDTAEKWAASMASVEQVTRHMHYGPLGLLFRALGLYWPIVTLSCASHATRLGAPVSEVAEECGPTALPTSRWWSFFDSDVDSAEVRAMFASMYERHNAAIRETVPPERLLEFNVRQGYAPLCRFLGIADEDCPADFPHVNEAAEMRMVGRIFMAMRFGWWLPIVLFFYLLRCCCYSHRKAVKAD